MSIRLPNIGSILIIVSILSATGCSSPPWHKQQAVSQQAKDAYFEQAVTRIQYDDVSNNSDEYQSQAVSETTYAPVPPVSRNASSGAGSCCH